MWTVDYVIKEVGGKRRLDGNIGKEISERTSGRKVLRLDGKIGGNIGGTLVGDGIVYRKIGVRLCALCMSICVLLL